MHGFIELTEENGCALLLRADGIDAVVSGEKRRQKLTVIYMRNGYKAIVRELIDEIDELLGRAYECATPKGSDNAAR